MSEQPDPIDQVDERQRLHLAWLKLRKVIDRMGQVHDGMQDALATLRSGAPPLASLSPADRLLIREAIDIRHDGLASMVEQAKRFLRNDDALEALQEFQAKRERLAQLSQLFTER
ncbi:MAG TPA: hypothetical protein VG433_10090 [Pirellulales bacterium]|jgi:hypothetical protein|nr:hypothetical protein [Pirellulales bacterium]